FFRPPLGGFRGTAGGSHAIVVHLETAVQAEARVEDERAQEGAGGVPGGGEPGGERLDGRIEAERAVVANAVVRRIQAGEDRRVRRQRQRHVRVGGLEAHAVARQAVERGCRT